MDMRSLEYDGTAKKLISGIARYLYNKYNPTGQELWELAQLVIIDWRQEAFLLLPCKYFSADWLNRVVDDLIRDMEKQCDTAGKALLWIENQNLNMTLDSL